ncbi:uncharacterized protein LOC123404174 [Hordeum vulgare subsp. vulgare]|uniref:Uncharacterized protein n=1 Tax=Hordeum vulgare subsp. vulgare TaxID=112509 RepID=A0A8I6Y416_HORVV|nr:uncharacterized protein LOC123404174 [Hordeum vulgare subsp. vulgare]
MSAVMKVQTEYNNKAGTIHMSGCHLFFQIFLLDNIDLGIFNMRHSVFPRVQCFDQKRLRQMITMAQCKQRGVLTYVPGAVRPPDSVCYTRVVAMSPLCTDATSVVASSKQPVSSMPMTPNYKTRKDRVDENTGQLNLLADPMSASRSIGPADFSKYLREICKDDPVLEELSLMLKQHNAKCTLSTTLLRNQLQSDMLLFANKMVALAKRRWRCCHKRGLSKCITLEADGEEHISHVPVSKCGRRLNMSEEEGI